MAARPAVPAIAATAAIVKPRAQAEDIEEGEQLPPPAVFGYRWACSSLWYSQGLCSLTVILLFSSLSPGREAPPRHSIASNVRETTHS